MMVLALLSILDSRGGEGFHAGAAHSSSPCTSSLEARGGEGQKPGLFCTKEEEEGDE